MAEPTDYAEVARQLLRALRGKRSQVAFSRRLGFRSNVAAKWESGQRMPNALHVLVFSERLKRSPQEAIRAFHAGAAPALAALDAAGLARWLSALRGRQSLKVLAERSGLSRYSVARILAGQSEPRLPQFLALVDALTDRLFDLIEGWVTVDQVPLMAARYHRAKATREALFRKPICLAVLCLLDTQGLRCVKAKQVARLTRTLEQPEHLIWEALTILHQGGVIDEVAGRYALSGALTVEANAEPQEETLARRYWTELAHQRALKPLPLDLFSYNVFSISRADFEGLRELQRDYYRSARTLIAGSEPTDLAGLLLVQLVSWEPDPVKQPDSEGLPASLASFPLGEHTS